MVQGQQGSRGRSSSWTPMSRMEECLDPRRRAAVDRRLRGRLALLRRPGAVGALFAEDATYAYHPYDEGDEVVRGREAIVADWLKERDEPGTWQASYRPLVVEGRRAVAEGTTSYANGDFYWNLWTLRFDEEDRCAEFVECFMVRPRD